MARPRKPCALCGAPRCCDLRVRPRDGRRHERRRGYALIKTEKVPACHACHNRHMDFWQEKRPCVPAQRGRSASTGGNPGGRS